MRSSITQIYENKEVMEGNQAARFRVWVTPPLCVEFFII